MESTQRRGISRRELLAGGAVLGAGLAAGLAGCAATPAKDDGNDVSEEAPADAIATDAEELRWDMEADVVVVGSGTGMGAAIAAGAEGASVIVLEKRSVNGGSLAFSGGYAWMVKHRFSREHGDSEELARTYLEKMQRGEGDDVLSDAFLANGDAVIDLLAEKCIC